MAQLENFQSKGPCPKLKPVLVLYFTLVVIYTVSSEMNNKKRHTTSSITPKATFYNQC